MDKIIYYFIERDLRQIHKHTELKENADAVSDSQRYKMLGNGWTIDVIAYIFSYINKIIYA